MMKVTAVVMGYGLDSDGLHSPNEHYSVEMFHRGIETARLYLGAAAAHLTRGGQFGIYYFWDANIRLRRRWEEGDAGQHRNRKPR